MTDPVLLCFGPMFGRHLLNEGDPWLQSLTSKSLYPPTFVVRFSLSQVVAKTLQKGTESTSNVPDFFRYRVDEDVNTDDHAPNVTGFEVFATFPFALAPSSSKTAYYRALVRLAASQPTRTRGTLG